MNKILEILLRQEETIDLLKKDAKDLTSCVKRTKHKNTQLKMEIDDLKNELAMANLTIDNLNTELKEVKETTEFYENLLIQKNLIELKMKKAKGF